MRMSTSRTKSQSEESAGSHCFIGDARLQNICACVSTAEASTNARHSVSLFLGSVRKKKKEGEKDMKILQKKSIRPLLVEFVSWLKKTTKWGVGGVYERKNKTKSLVCVCFGSHSRLTYFLQQKNG